jgi:hypothetical protein
MRKPIMSPDTTHSIYQVIPNKKMKRELTSYRCDTGKWKTCILFSGSLKILAGALYANP